MLSKASRGPRRLWLSVAQHVVEDRSLATAEAAGILDECALLSIEDILPFFPDFAVIDAFKSEICRSLQGYNVAVSALKAETDDALAAAADLRGKMQRLGAATAALPADTRCALSGKRVVTGPFYVFSSGYAYLAEALLAHARPHLGEAQRRRVDDVVQALESGGGTEAHALLQAELDSLIAGECPLTGALMIDSVDKPLRASGTDDWAI